MGSYLIVLMLLMPIIQSCALSRGTNYGEYLVHVAVIHESSRLEEEIRRDFWGIFPWSLGRSAPLDCPGRGCRGP